MFGFFKKQAIKTSAELQLEFVKNALFPPLRLRKDKKGMKFHVDCSVDTNLDAALTDLIDGNNDEISQATIRKVADRLFQLRKYLEVERKLNPKVKALIVEDLEVHNIESIKAGKE